jgi:adenylate kinase family enzyme
MKMLNEEFNSFRGLFPLKVYIGGPAATGKSHFASRLASGYGIPHLTISEMLNEAKNAGDQLGHDICKKIEELKDIEVAAYEKSRKKKDPDIDRSSLKPRIPDDLL